jgi:uncharacterized protein YfaP (DUF2135 family)
MFETLKQKVKDQFAELVKNGTLFTVNPDRDKIWEIYLQAIPEAFRQSNTCNCCKSFLRQYGGIVGIKDNKVITLWDFELDDEEYGAAVKALRRYVASLPVADLFLNDFPKLGTDRNPDTKRGLIWTHFYVEAPRNFVVGKDRIPTVLGERRTLKELLARAIKEITPDAVTTVQELIGQGSLYRGAEFKGIIDAFDKAQRAAKGIPAALFDNYCWKRCTEVGPAVCSIRNSSIGTLLQALSEGTDLDAAVSAFERVVAPTNYKRPTALVTPRMVDVARTRLEELGLTGALKRRQLDSRDLSAADALFVYRPTKKTNDVFDQLKENAIVHPKTLSKVDEVSIDEFLTGVLPTAKSVKVLVENRHLPNLVSLVGAVEEGPTLFKWGNNFSWSYVGEVADSIKERVKAAGGDVTGALRVSLSWSNFDDLDLHIKESGGYEIYYGNRNVTSPTGGKLDVDMNAGGGHTRTPVENVTWPRLPRYGTYVVNVNQFNRREHTNTGFEIEIEVEGELHSFSLPTPSQGATTTVATITVAQSGVTVSGSEGKPTRYSSREAWGLKTGTFQPVSAVTLSPNHWGANVGNKHVFFLLKGCKADQRIRPFYNEFLKEELSPDRKVFEILAGKIDVEPREDELSGLGFSDTIRNHIFAEVEGAFKRIVKVNF